MTTGIKRRRTRALAVVAAVAACVALLSLPVAAAQLAGSGGKFLSGPDVVVRAGEVVTHDLYVSGGQVLVEGDVDGDLLAAGGTVTVEGAVTGDLMAAGGTVMLSGDVAGDVRTAGGSVTVDGPVAEDLLVAGGDVVLAAPGRVGEDLIFAAGAMRRDGDVSGNVLGSTGDYESRGSVGGRERVRIERPEPEAPPTLAERVLDQVQRYIGVLVVGALVLLVLPGLLRPAADSARRRLPLSLGVGVLGVVGYGVGLILLILVTVLVAVLLGLLGLGSLVATVVFAGLLAAAALSFAFFLVVLFLAQAVIGLAIGQPLFARGDESSTGRELAALAVGTLVVVLVTALPYVGPPAGLLVVLLGLGAVLVAQRRRPAAPAQA
ncbi:MAG: hypothetical protein M3N17_01430 [Actinomycetota bacterium]|nr:hypothetical protein [Actinomycetota bacterium]